MQIIKSHCKNFLEISLRGFKSLFQRNVIFYIAAIIITIVSVDISNVIYTSRVKVLDRLRPDLCFLLNIGDAHLNQEDNFTKSVLKKAVFFYNKLNEYIPSLHAEVFYPDSYAMLGYCYYYLGDIDKAEYYYKKAIKLNPVYIWFYHNLGVIYFRKGEYENAFNMFKRAIGTDPKINMKVITSSRIFTQVYASCADKRINPFLRQKIAYKDSFMLLVLSNYYQKKYYELLRYTVSAIKEGLDKKGFFSYYSGLASFRIGQYKDAMSFFEECIKKRPNFADAYYYYALCLQSLGKDNMALRFLKQALYLRKNKNDVMPDGTNITLKIF